MYFLTLSTVAGERLFNSLFRRDMFCFSGKKILPPNVFEKIIDPEDAKMKIICPCSF
jgi:hypothetical protein